MIYFIENKDGYIKIGSTSNLKQRIARLQTSDPFPLKVLYTIDIPDEESLIFEKHVHSICVNYLISGEWYKKSVLEEHLLKHPYYKKNMKLYDSSLLV